MNNKSNPTDLSNIIGDMKKLCHVCGGQLFIQCGPASLPDKPRTLWRICEISDKNCSPAVVSAQQITDSCAMRAQMSSQPPAWVKGEMHYGWIVVYILRGRGELWTENNRFALSAGSLFIIPPGEKRLYAPPAGSTWDEFSFVLRGEIFDSWFKAGLYNPEKPVLRLLPIEKWLKRLHEIIIPLAGFSDRQEPRHWAAIISFLAEVLEYSILAPGDWRQEWLIKAKAALLLEPLQPSLNLKRVAAALSVSPRTFRRRFTELCNMTPHHFHSLRLMDSVGTMLIEGDSLATIAHNLGFANEFYLSRRFKQITGLTPSEYRIKWQELR